MGTLADLARGVVMSRLACGADPAALAAELDLPRLLIRNIARHFGLQTTTTTREGEYRAAAAAGLTVAETAARLGVVRRAVYLAARHYGISFAPAFHPPHPLTDILVAEYRAGATLAAVGARHGISRERVRQLLVAHEKATGEAIPRHPPPQAPRFERRCVRCGRPMGRRAKFVTATRLAALASVCKSCHASRHDLTPPVLDAYVVRRLAGERWSRIAAAAGYAPATYHLLYRAVALYLYRAGRKADLTAAFAGQKTAWLRKYGIVVP